MTRTYESTTEALRIPVIDGLQAQGDLLVVPLEFVSGAISWHADPVWTYPTEIELLRGAAGGNPHVLVAEPGTCRWTTDFFDSERLAIGIFQAIAVAYLMHPEHGASGCAPGTYLVRRQREFEGFRTRLVAD
ncbi:hypothetical protein [Nocardia goodfellowii]|uniref:Uncharacterized protein n=1 Tax=Nocardia goodfellowii TaxID=882446 RepID=A0ABS4QNT8_9NOCA|nr:hypothetical protein [Nocardia goodfellowii]MBP2193380.1 hypothetical protein [Nocardia goodfellowii]